MENFVGLLIRRERLEKNYSQEGLCRGICAVSYLSKIEQGKAQAGDDVVVPLLARLGIDFETDPEFLAWGEALVVSLYEKLLTGREEDCRQKLEELAEKKERLLRSPYMLDALLLEGLDNEEDHLPELLDRLEPFAGAMDRRQYPLRDGRSHRGSG